VRSGFVYPVRTVSEYEPDFRGRSWNKRNTNELLLAGSPSGECHRRPCELWSRNYQTGVSSMRRSPCWAHAMEWDRVLGRDGSGSWRGWVVRLTPSQSRFDTSGSAGWTHIWLSDACVRPMFILDSNRRMVFAQSPASVEPRHTRHAARTQCRALAHSSLKLGSPSIAKPSVLPLSRRLYLYRRESVDGGSARSSTCSFQNYI